MADASVRPARGQDVPEIARIQLDTWRLAYTRLLPEPLLAAVTQEQAEATWAAAVTAPPSPRHHVLVALENETIVGFVAFGPADPADAEKLDTNTWVTDSDPAGNAGTAETGTAERSASAQERPAEVGSIMTLLVEPRWGRRGHGSRLLAATVDHLRTDGINHALTWVLDRDKASASFYESAGWQRDGYARALDADGHQVREIRLHALLDAPADTADSTDLAGPSET